MTRRQNFFGQIVAAADMVVVLAIFLVAYQLRVKLWRLGYPMLPISRPRANGWILAIAFPAWLIAFRYFNLYDPISYRSAFRVVVTTFKANFAAAALWMNMIFILHGFPGASRALMALMIGLSFIAMTSEKLAIVLAMRSRPRLRRPSTVWRVLLVGSRTDAESYLQLVREHPEWNMEIVDIISATREETIRGVDGELRPAIEQ
jgi:FlaA1/EpsC-like NDP-sugar epimerase